MTTDRNGNPIEIGDDVLIHVKNVPGWIVPGNIDDVDCMGEYTVIVDPLRHTLIGLMLLDPGDDEEALTYDDGTMAARADELEVVRTYEQIRADAALR